MPHKLRSRVAWLREQAGLTQIQLAALVGVTPNTVQNWEKSTGLNQLEKYLKLCEIFGLEKLEDLFETVEILEESKAQTKGFSLEQLREIREIWGTNVEIKANIEKVNTKVEASYPIKKSSRKSLQELQELIGTEKTAITQEKIKLEELKDLEG